MSFASLRSWDIDKVKHPTFFVVPAARRDPPNPWRADLGGHPVTELETRGGDPNEPLRIYTKFPTSVVANNDKGSILGDTAVKDFSFVRPFEEALRVVRGHETRREVITENTPSPNERRGSSLAWARVVSIPGFLSYAKEFHGS
jgi:hypothetical protein